MLRILAALTAVATSCTLEAYDIEQLIRDTRKNPDKIYRNLHPAAKSFVDRGIELYQTNPAYREEKYVEFETDPAKMKPARIWADNGYTEFYDNGYTVIHSHDQGEWRYVTVKEEGYSEEVLMIDTYVFRKHGDTYLFYPPGWIMDYYSPIDYLEPSDDPVKNALFELLIKTRIEENMTEADKEAFKNATTPAEVAELMQKLMSPSAETRSQEGTK